MIVPRFKLTQDSRFVTIKIDAPHCSLKEFDADINENVFLFVCRPYYLRLNLPGNLIADKSDSVCSFDSDSSEFTFRCEKETPGEHFKDLDLITKFLTNSVGANYNDGKPKIEILFNETEEDKEFSCNTIEYGFGFALRARKDLIRISSEFSDVFEIDPCKVSVADRGKMRLQYEQGKFNSEHYCADLLEDQEINDIIAQDDPWSDSNEFKFTNREDDFMRNLNVKVYDLTDKQLNYCYNGLIDILYAYCYDRRTMMYEESIESGWTIIKLAATLSWLDAFETPKKALTSAFRRSVIYPLYRNFRLSEKVFEDVKKLMCLDKRYLVRCLIDIYFIFLKGDCCRYIVNNLFINDYITFIMHWDEAKWKAFTDKVLSIKIQKDDLGLNLVQTEASFKMSAELAQLSIASDDGSDDSSEDSSDDSDDTSESDSSAH
ncbi:protein SHQ1 homolog [Cylas formicarius]|uniref:protein SHQ1 homolog n=1 Tax=Cylas formicarius TaxID=197179 RepID=UPI0029588C0B|nr:protein SHQ1 homolog [Cylas formicarius]